MNASHFADLVKNCFGFLEDLSFAYTWDGGFSVRFNSSTVFVAVVYDATRSYELRIEIGLQAGIVRPIERPFSVSELLRVAGRPDLAEATSLIQARPDEVGDRLEWLANVLSKHGQEFLNGELEVFNALDEQREADCRAYAARSEVLYAKREAAKAWNEKNYGEVVRQLDPIKEYLAASEQKRLEIARRRSSP